MPVSMPPRTSGKARKRGAFEAEARAAEGPKADRGMGIGGVIALRIERRVGGERTCLRCDSASPCSRESSSSPCRGERDRRSGWVRRARSGSCRAMGRLAAIRHDEGARIAGDEADEAGIGGGERIGAGGTEMGGIDHRAHADTGSRARWRRLRPWRDRWAGGRARHRHRQGRRLRRGCVTVILGVGLQMPVRRQSA